MLKIKETLEKILVTLRNLTAYRDTNNTTNNWVPVWNYEKLEHRIIPNVYNHNTNEIFTVTEHTPSAHSVAASSYEGWSLGTFTKANYYPIGIVGFDMSGTGTGQCVPIKYYLSAQSVGSATAYVGVRNNRTSATSVVFTVYILWVKTTY